MRPKATLPLLVLVAPVIVACAATPDPRTEFIGAKAENIASCLGEPARKERVAGRETWTYYLADGVTSSPVASPSLSLPLRSNTPPDGANRACRVVVKLESSHVTALDYQNLALAEGDGSCAASLDRCPRRN